MTSTTTVAALFVHPGGVYFGLPDVDPWDVTRDARLYAGPFPCVAHPPCERWGRYWNGGPRADPSKAGHQPRKLLGDDGGCFRSALAAVRRCGGVLEHPEASHAWAAHLLRKPPRAGGWVTADAFGGRTCCVEQGHYGHPSRKLSWLYAVLPTYPELPWGSSGQRVRPVHKDFSYEERRRKGVVGFQAKSQRHLSPPAFRDLLLDMARSCCTVQQRAIPPPIEGS